MWYEPQNFRFCRTISRNTPVITVKNNRFYYKYDFKKGEYYPIFTKLSENFGGKYLIGELFILF